MGCRRASVQPLSSLSFLLNHDAIGGGRLTPLPACEDAPDWAMYTFGVMKLFFTHFPTTQANVARPLFGGAHD